MSIKSKLIHFPSIKSFLTALLSATSSTNGLWGTVPDTAIAFIDDTHEIWTHGKFYGAKSYFEGLGSGFLNVNNSQVGAIKSLNLWGRYLSPSDPTLNGEITIREGVYPKYDSNGNPVMGDRGVVNEQLPARVNLMASGASTVNNIGWHLNGPNYESSSNNNLNFSISYTNAEKTESTYLTLTDAGAMTLAGKGFNVSGYSTIANGSNYGLTTSSENGNIIAQNAYLQGKYLNNTPINFSSNLSDVYNWNQIKQRAGSLIVTIEKTAAYLIASSNAPLEGWRPWIAAVDSANNSWGIGLGGSSFWIGTIGSGETKDQLTKSWQFNADGYITATGYKVIGGSADYVLLANGDLKLISDIKSLADFSNISAGEGEVLIGPVKNTTSGTTTVASFRKLVESDLPDLSRKYLTSHAYRSIAILNSSDTESTSVFASTVSGTLILQAGDNNISLTTSTKGSDKVVTFTTKNTWTAFKGASDTGSGTAGYIPAPEAGLTNLYFRSDGTWSTPANTTYNLYLGTLNATSNATTKTANDTTYLNLRNSSNSNNNIQITGSGSVSVKAKDGVLTITGTNHTLYYAPTTKATEDNAVWVATKPLTGDCTYSWKALGTNAFSSKTFAEAVIGNLWAVLDAMVTKTITLSTSDWVAACDINTFDSGTYAIQLNGPNVMASGVFSIIKNSTDTQKDEIPLHNMGTGDALFAKVDGAKLYIASLGTGNKSISIKIKRLI